ncbi:uncharacterized protein EI90DRAFT_2124639 [Cantharellus anzutake]|uniref:uncharacterized protein n=1 Tax=Cantharellus anzutake TaxID=1750568 RepID=UPI0019032869|nr:uncharacterized protein EI90DRAFT_2124639 [Cantharellus anzutake]KAF8325586.1 hypothetical protein EI90DRAFT_2124639 [Cantharellus anzutake]
MRTGASSCLAQTTNRSEASPPGSSRKRAKYNRACTSCHQAQRKCDRRWEVEGASCSRCTGWGLNVCYVCSRLSEPGFSTILTRHIAKLNYNTQVRRFIIFLPFADTM